MSLWYIYEVKLQFSLCISAFRMSNKTRFSTIINDEKLAHQKWYDDTSRINYLYATQGKVRIVGNSIVLFSAHN